MSFAVRWPVLPSERAAGNTLGYSTANRGMLDAVQRAGVTIDDAAPIAMHFCFPKRYVPEPGCKNVLFTMFESTDPKAMRTVFAPAFAQADIVLTPSNWCAELFRKWTDRPVAAVPLGVDTKLFPYKRRRFRAGREPFTFLYVGAPNSRKWTVLPDLYDALIRPLGEHARLYIKTTGARMAADALMGKRGAERVEVETTPEGPIIHGRLGSHELVTVDCRVLPRARVPEVYYFAHAKLFLHCGEGWGLTGLEAMASGLPLIVSDVTGTRDYANHQNAYPVRVTTQSVQREGVGVAPYVGPWPDVEHAIEQAGRVMHDYSRSVTIAKRGSEAAQCFTWNTAGRKLATALRNML